MLRHGHQQRFWDSEYRGAVQVRVAVRVAETGAVTGAVAGAVGPGPPNPRQRFVTVPTLDREFRGADPDSAQEDACFEPKFLAKSERSGFAGPSVFV